MNDAAETPIMQEHETPAAPKNETRANGRTRTGNTDDASRDIAAHLGKTVFSDLKAITPGKPFQDGTIQTRLTEVAVELGKTGIYMQGLHICSRQNGDQIRLIVQWPTGANRFQKLLKANDPKAQQSLDAWEEKTIAAWKKYRAEQIKAGHVQTVATSGHTVGKDELVALGFGKV